MFDDAGVPVPGRTGYIDHPADRGGETNFGITTADARKWGYAGSMAAISFDLVESIYRADYWTPMRGDEMTNQAIAEEVFDTSVNCGAVTGRRFLQEALNELNNQGKKYAEIVVDGLVGPRTLETLQFALALAPAYEAALLKSLNGQQYQRYRTICLGNPGQEVFMLGWLLRV